MKIVSIVGTRPNLIKEYAICGEFRKKGMEEILVHAGQHYDYEMSEVFIQELRLPRPKYLNTIIKGSYAEETSAMMTFIEAVLIKEKPAFTLVYGDVNSTLAAAVASAKLRIPVVHIEAGIRSNSLYNPEEINRRVTDSISEVLFPVTRDAYDNLIKEGFDSHRVFLCGDIVLDSALKAMEEHNIKVTNEGYDVATFHRIENIGNKERLTNIVEAIIASGKKTFFPVHPHTEKKLKTFGLWDKLTQSQGVEPTAPLSFVKFLKLLSGCDKVITDSGSVRREGYMLKKPVITLTNLVWFPELVSSGWNCIADASDRNGMIKAIAEHGPGAEHPPIFGDGKAAERIVDILEKRYMRSP